MTERNPYHEPAGSSIGGQFTSGQLKVIGNAARKAARVQLSANEFGEKLGIKIENLGHNTVWEYLDTSKGKAGVQLNSEYFDAVQIHWLTATQRGAGREAMNKIIKLADETGTNLVGWARPMTGNQSGIKFQLSRTKLEKFYKSFGFKVISRDNEGFAFIQRIAK